MKEWGFLSSIEFIQLQFWSENGGAAGCRLTAQIHLGRTEPGVFDSEMYIMNLSSHKIDDTYDKMCIFKVIAYIYLFLID